MSARALIENDDIKGELLSVEGVPGPDEVTYALTAVPEDHDPEWERPTDNEADGEAHDRMLRDMAHRRYLGDVWAFCIATVTASWTDREGVVHTGSDSLGDCSYANAEEFKQPGGYYDDMKGEAYANLLTKLERKS